MRSPRWARWLLARLAPSGREKEVVGDLEEAHLLRERRHGRRKALAWTAFETLDMATMLLRNRLTSASGLSWLDVKLGARMLVRHPGLTCKITLRPLRALRLVCRVGTAHQIRTANNRRNPWWAMPTLQLRLAIRG